MFVAKDYEMSVWVKMHNYFAGLFGRKDLLRKFCTDNGIDYKPKRNQKYCFPEKSLIEHKELSYLSSVRDKLILSFYDDYRDAQKENLENQDDLRVQIENQKNIIDTCKMRLKKNQVLLRRAKSPIDQIHYEDLVASAKTRIQNEKNNEKILESSLRNKELEYKTNVQNWNKQIGIIEKLLVFRRKNFEKNISKRVRRQLNYIDFYSNFDDYSDEVKKVLKGELYEQKD